MLGVAIFAVCLVLFVLWTCRMGRDGETHGKAGVSMGHTTGGGGGE